MAKKKAETQNFSKYIRWFWITITGGLLLIVLFFLLASWGVFGEMPDHTRLENPSTNLATEIISSDGELLAKIYHNDNRTPVEFTELPDHLVEALIATEDARFREHSGIDLRGTLRAIVKLGAGGGASTISQQLAKQLFHGEGSRNIIDRIAQKAKEWIIAIRLERQYTKEEIIAMYFNIYDFGNNADGIRSAARIYFGKEPKDLDVKESAMLVGMFKNSSLYNPRSTRNPEGTRNRRNVVLNQMEKYNYITTTVGDSLKKLDLGLRYTPESHREGLATYFRAYLTDFMRDWIKNNPKPDGSGLYSLYDDGLKIYTTIDSRMQQYAEDAVQEHMAQLQKEFFHQNTPERNKTAPFLDLKPEEITSLLNRSMRQS
ncbi:MAG: transglycosylase domain-containing protein, partial [Gelidibacter sp.]